MSSFYSDMLESFPKPVVRKAIIKSGPVLSHEGAIPDTSNVLCSSSGCFYELGSVIKKSIYGMVIRATVVVPSTKERNTLRRTERFVAIKVYSRKIVAANRGKSHEDPLSEIAALQFIGNNFPNVLGQIDCCMDNENIYSVLEFSSGSELFDYVLQAGAVNEQLVRLIFRQMLQAVVNLHSQGIAHRDISLENVLYDAKSNFVHVIDLGMCARLHRDDYCDSGILDSVNIHCGKANYMPPEVIRGDMFVDPMAGDVWSLGVCMLYMLLGFPPMETASESDVRFLHIAHGHLPELVAHWGLSLSADAMDLVQHMLQVDSADRPTAAALLAHPFFSAPKLQMPVNLTDMSTRKTLGMTNMNAIQVQVTC